MENYEKDYKESQRMMRYNRVYKPLGKMAFLSLILFGISQCSSISERVEFSSEIKKSIDNSFYDYKSTHSQFFK
jgi:hypothetical protein